MTDSAGRSGTLAFDEVKKRILLNYQLKATIQGGQDCPNAAEVVQRSREALNLQEKMANLDDSDCQKAKLIRAFLLAKYLQDDSMPCEIQKGVYLGSIGAACNKDVLQSLNITHILAIANNVEMPFPNDFKYKRIEVLDSPDVDLHQYFSACFDFIDEARGLGGGILVHCFAGRSRSVTVLVAYLMRTYSLSFSQALELVRLKRPEASPNAGFVRQLQNFEKHLVDAKTKQFGCSGPAA